MTDWPRIRATETRIKLAYKKYHFRKRKLEGKQISEKRGEYWLKVHRQKHEPKGIESANASIIRARAGIYKWGRLVGEEARNISAKKTNLAKLRPKPPVRHEGYSTPTAAWNPSRRPIANWIIPELEWAWAHGWRGYVTSGYRSYQKQQELYSIYLRGGNIAARPGYSNHEGYVYPRGAVDVTNYSSFANHRRPGHKLIWGIAIHDYVHFSGTGR